MLVRELIELLQKQSPEAAVEVSVGNPKDTAWSQEVSVKQGEEGRVVVSAWVYSQDVKAGTAFAPWSEYPDEDEG